VTASAHADSSLSPASCWQLEVSAAGRPEQQPERVLQLPEPLVVLLLLLPPPVLSPEQ